MKPFSGIHRKGSSQRVFNYRLSRPRRTVENIFGIASAVFRVLRKPMLLEPTKAELVVMTLAHLYNLLRNSSSALYTPGGIFDKEIDGTLVKGTYNTITNEAMSSLVPIRNIPRKSNEDAKLIREELAAYFQNEGRILWQVTYA
ncbi:hypothetical protein NQ314_008814 [Rhamnusium bicolor]|uniref:DDE Tnp4 domain-containing protein n=1 Tax=Rhamnusium bicolor TaxID=1586634 RepID=A0AAV8Y5A2_9CUCU|nr:hypothetical protein NQ314_008814 [Rhamnusium bicolor]